MLYPNELQRSNLFYNLLGRRIGHGAAIGENQCGHGAIAAIYFFNDLGSAFDFFDIDLIEGNSKICELGF